MEQISALPFPGLCTAVHKEGKLWGYVFYLTFFLFQTIARFAFLKPATLKDNLSRVVIVHDIHLDFKHCYSY